MSPAVVTLGVRYMRPVLSACIVTWALPAAQCSALALGAGTLYCQFVYLFFLSFFAYFFWRDYGMSFIPLLLSSAFQKS